MRREPGLPRYTRQMPFAPQEIRTFFVTTNTAGRRRLFQVESNAELLLNVLREDRAKGRYRLHAFVLMPDHVHLLLTPAGNVSLEKAMQYMKGGFSFRLKSKLSVWQPSFSLRRIEDARDYETHHQLHSSEPHPRRLMRERRRLSVFISQQCRRGRSRPLSSGERNPGLKALPNFDP